MINCLVIPVESPSSQLGRFSSPFSQRDSLGKRGTESHEFIRVRFRGLLKFRHSEKTKALKLNLHG